MAKYSQFDNKKKVKARYKIHPVWAGIGFLMVILVPIITWVGATELISFGQTQHWPVLSSFPRFLSPGILSGIPGMNLLSQIENLPAISIFFVLMLIIISGVLSMVYAFVYRIVGPPRYAPDDIPAPRVKTKPFKR